VDYDYLNKSIVVPEILMYSSNIGTSMLMKEIGLANQIRYLNRFNLFSATHLEIQEKEKSITQAKWNDLTAMTVSYGYGLAISQATFINAFGAVINGGNFMPLTIKKVKNYENLQKTRVLSEKTSYEMRRMLRLTVAKGGGRRGDVAGYSVGGKTGSAEKQIKGKYNFDKVISSFLAFFPSNKPQYAIIISINEPKRLPYNNYNVTGGYLSAPVTAEIISNIAIANGLEKTTDDTVNLNRSNQQEILNYVRYKNIPEEVK
jgi:cell division protein FtsI (penicillin-binding protein 3)